MKSVCTLEIELPDAETARNIAKALELDNAGYVDAKVVGNVIHALVESDNVMALRNTVDDFLACATVALKSLEGSK